MQIISACSVTKKREIFLEAFLNFPKFLGGLTSFDLRMKEIWKRRLFQKNESVFCFIKLMRYHNLIHAAEPQCHGCPSVPTFQNLGSIVYIIFNYCRDCGNGQVDLWYLLFYATHLHLMPFTIWSNLTN